jgi:hypothetical protein
MEVNGSYALPDTMMADLKARCNKYKQGTWVPTEKEGVCESFDAPTHKGYHTHLGRRYYVHFKNMDVKDEERFACVYPKCTRTFKTYKGLREHWNTERHDAKKGHGLDLGPRTIYLPVGTES